MKKVICSRCKKRPAVIFISKIIDGKTVPEGLCLQCAMEMNIGPIKQMMDSMGITEEDVEAISYIIRCGCGILATVHGESVDDIRTKPVFRKLVEEKMFDRYIVLSNRNGIGSIENIFDERGNALYMPSPCVVGL